MLEKLFKSKTTVRVLSLLLFGGEFHVREIARRVGITPTYVQKELRTLEGIGLVSERRLGNLSLWKARRESPVFEDLKRLFLKTDCLGGYLSGLLRDDGVTYAIVFGSVARGSEGEKSDIDLLVIGSLSDDALFTRVEEAEKQLGREINYILWREKDFSKRARKGHPLLREIVKNPVIWLAGDEHGFRETVARRIHQRVRAQSGSKPKRA